MEHRDKSIDDDQFVADPPPTPSFQGGEQAVPVATPSLSGLTARLREHILDAQDKLEAGDIKGAEALGRATLQLIKALDAQIALEASQKETNRKGVFYDADDIARARAELTRRLDRLAKTLRADEMGGGAAR